MPFPSSVPLAFASSVAFSSIALYITVVEHPARQALDPLSAVKHWLPSFTRAAAMQSALTLTASMAAYKAYKATSNKLFLVASGLAFAIVPFTFACIMPTNKKLMSLHTTLTQADSSVSDATKQQDLAAVQGQLSTWGKVHAVRTVTSIISSTVLYYAIFQQ